MSGMDVLRERIARAIHEDDLARFPETFEWESSATNREAYYSSADAVIAALGLKEQRGDWFLREDTEIRRYITPWEWIADDSHTST